MKKVILLPFMCLLIYSCSSNSASNTGTGTASGTDLKAANGNPSYDPNRGEGKFMHVDLGTALDEKMAANGKKIYDIKCGACHKLTTEKLVGPGWTGVTTRHSPEWIMNFVTNTDIMLNKDPKAQAMLELCMVRMPNQNLSDDDARALLEFMRQNDGVK